MTILEPAQGPPAAEAPPAGWYPDPRDPRLERWWNGSAWRDHTRERVLPPSDVRPGGGYAPVRTPRGDNGAAYWSLGLGILSLLLVLSTLLTQTHGFWLSTTGVVAVVAGIRALRRRSAGRSSALLPAVLGIVFGALGASITLAMLLGATFTGSGGSGEGVQGGTAVQSGAQAVPSASPDGVLQAVAPSTLPDDALKRYTTVEVRSVTTVAAGCGVLTAQQQVMPDQDPRTPARMRQDDISAQAQAMTEQLTTLSHSTRSWPKTIDVAPDTRTVFTPAPSCTPLGVLPKDTDLEYATSPDHGQVALAILDPALKVGSLWRSVDDTLYQL